MTTDEDKLLNFDFHYASCLLALDDFADALTDLYLSIWLMTSGNDEATNEHYAATYQGLTDRLFDEVGELETTDEFRAQYEQGKSNDTED